MLITSDSHRLPHEHALAVLLEGRGPVVAVKRLAQSSATRWQEHPNFGHRGRGGQGGQSGRRQRQFQAVLGSDRVTFSSDTDERYQEAFTPRVSCLMAGMNEAYAL